MLAYASLFVALALPAAAPQASMGGFAGRGFHPNYTPHYGCFGYCNGPLRPSGNHAMCFGYCPGPVNPHWGCYGYCNGPLYPGGYAWGPAVVPVPEYIPGDPTAIYQGNLSGQVTLPPPPAPAPAGGSAPLDDGPLPIAFKNPVDDWVKQLANPSAKKRGEAVEALGRFGPRAAKAVDALIPLLADRDAHLRVEVTMTLAKIGADAVPALIQAVASDDKLIQMGACLTLGHMGKRAAAALPALKATLKAKDSAVRCHAAQAMLRIDPATKNEVLNVLVDGLTDDSRAVRLGALTTLSQLGAAAEPAIPAIMKLLEDKDGQIRIAAAVTLSNIAPTNTSALPVLVAGLGDSAAMVRRDAAASLAHLSLSSLDANMALAPLAKALQDSDANVVHFAAIALAHLGEPALKPLAAGLADANPSVRRYCVLALEQMGKTAASALPKLKEISNKDTDDEIRFQAAEAVQTIEGAK